MNKAIFFDLDGTVIDSAPDFLFAFNRVLSDYNMPEAQYSDLAPIVSYGSNAIISLYFSDSSRDEKLKVKEKFLEYYYNLDSQNTRIYNKVSEALNYLTDNNILWGVVTNKVESSAIKVCEKFNIKPSENCIVGRDTVGVGKPSPEPLLHAATLLKVEPENCVYVGDADLDVAAANSAGMHSVLVHYSYTKYTDDAENKADISIFTEEDLFNWVQKWAVAK